jgi:hypothetical protein
MPRAPCVRLKHPPLSPEESCKTTLPLVMSFPKNREASRKRLMRNARNQINEGLENQRVRMPVMIAVRNIQSPIRITFSTGCDRCCCTHQTLQSSVVILARPWHQTTRSLPGSHCLLSPSLNRLFGLAPTLSHRMSLEFKIFSAFVTLPTARMM